MHRAASPRLAALKARAAVVGRTAAAAVRASALSLGGAALVSAGIAMIYRPAGVIAAGVFVLWIDRMRTAS